mmetsp:Transcript_3391/g.10630  ORF Transcript_3391/g.10630 Transcript_3391/m.10630 type:complete len:272 (+) Transcript_3391:243-1058(+)
MESQVCDAILRLALQGRARQAGRWGHQEGGGRELQPSAHLRQKLLALGFVESVTLVVDQDKVKPILPLGIPQPVHNLAHGGLLLRLQPARAHQDDFVDLEEVCLEVLLDGSHDLTGTHLTVAEADRVDDVHGALPPQHRSRALGDPHVPGHGAEAGDGGADGLVVKHVDEIRLPTTRGSKQHHVEGFAGLPLREGGLRPPVLDEPRHARVQGLHDHFGLEVNGKGVDLNWGFAAHVRPESAHDEPLWEHLPAHPRPCDDVLAHVLGVPQAE